MKNLYSIYINNRKKVKNFIQELNDCFSLTQLYREEKQIKEYIQMHMHDVPRWIKFILSVQVLNAVVRREKQIKSKWAKF